MKTYYYIYQITNTVNAKIYVGVHKTKSLDDGYMGSGKIIRSAIQKHGISNFSKVILEFFDTSEAMYAKEKEIVTDEFLLREDTYNLRRGGTGGFDFINKEELGVCNLLNPIVKEKTRQSMISRLRDYGRTNKEIMGTNKMIDTLRSQYENGRISVFKTLNLDPEFQAKRKESFARMGHQQGSKNSNFGTMWITDGIDSKKIKKDNPIPEGWNKGRS